MRMLAESAKAMRQIGRTITNPRALVTPEPLLAAGGLAGRSIFTADDLSRAELADLFRLAARLQAGEFSASALLADRVVLTAFFEPSTRTRLSFESCALRLGARVLDVARTDALSIAKGESLADTGTMLANYADLIVVRHPSSLAMAELARGAAGRPFVNAGNGIEHPTQAMVDWFSLCKWNPSLLSVSLGVRAEPRLHLGVLGSPGTMRSVRSFLRFGIRFFAESIASITLVDRDPAALDGAMRAELSAAGISYAQEAEFDDDASRFDVLYQNVLRPGHDPKSGIGDAPRLGGHTLFKPSTVVLHPLARLTELATDLDDTPHNLYFDQAAGAVFVRQALLLALLQRLPVTELPGVSSLRER